MRYVQSNFVAATKCRSIPKFMDLTHRPLVSQIRITLNPLRTIKVCLPLKIDRIRATCNKQASMVLKTMMDLLKLRNEEFLLMFKLHQ